MTTPITRKDAASESRVYYFTGKPCKHGHVARRFVSTGTCEQCTKDSNARFRKTLTKAANGRMQGAFVYMLHPDDHAAALAYCQSLDIGRGRVPHVPGATAMPPPVAFVLPEHIARAREALVASQVPQERDSDYPDFTP